MPGKLEENVKDYSAGSKWYTYSQALGGYGCFFLHESQYLFKYS